MIEISGLEQKLKFSMYTHLRHAGHEKKST